MWHGYAHRNEKIVGFTHMNVPEKSPIKQLLMTNIPSSFISYINVPNLAPLDVHKTSTCNSLSCSCSSSHIFTLITVQFSIIRHHAYFGTLTVKLVTKIRKNTPVLPPKPNRATPRRQRHHETAMPSAQNSRRAGPTACLPRRTPRPRPQSRRLYHACRRSCGS